MRYGRKTKLESLHELRAFANFTNFSPGETTPGDIESLNANKAKFIRDQTETYRRSWINPIIDELIAAEVQKRTMAAERKAARR